MLALRAIFSITFVNDEVRDLDTTSMAG